MVVVVFVFVLMVLLAVLGVPPLWAAVLALIPIAIWLGLGLLLARRSAKRHQAFLKQ